MSLAGLKELVSATAIIENITKKKCLTGFDLEYLQQQIELVKMISDLMLEHVEKVKNGEVTNIKINDE